VSATISIELLGADDVVLARATSVNDKPGIVTVVDSSGGQILRSRRSGPY
jgi:hypothetical protein